MASSIPSPAPLDFSDGSQKLDFESVRLLVSIVNNHIHEIIEDEESRLALKQKCTSKLKTEAKHQEFFEFSEHSVLSSFYYGIECVEAAILSKNIDERTRKVENLEKMLQVPASLDENGVTLGIMNSHLVCCSYFYLSIVEVLRKNEWQVAMHFLQALLVHPRLLHTELAPGVCRSLFPLFVSQKGQRFGSRRVSTVCFDDIEEGIVDDTMRWIVRRYKPWLMYYQIMSSGDDVRPENEITSANDRSQCAVINKSKSMKPQNSFEERSGLRTQHNICAKTPCQIKTISNDDEKELSATQNSASSSIKCLKDILSESQPDTPTSLRSCSSTSLVEFITQDYAEDSMTSSRNGRTINQCDSLSWNAQAPSCRPRPERTVSTLRDSVNQLNEEDNEIKVVECIPRSFSTSFCDIRKMDQCTPLDDFVDETESLEKHQYIGQIALESFQFSRSLHKKCVSRIKKSSSTRTMVPVHSHPEESGVNEQCGLLEKIISKLCFTEELGNGEEDYTTQMKTIYEILNSKSGLKYSLLKDIILDQLLTAITTSKEERVVRTSVAILSTIVTANRSLVDDIKRKGLQLYDLVTALKRNVHEAIILIYLINPSPAEIKTLELLPCLLDVVCASKSYKIELTTLALTPPAASLMILELLVTAFDYETNSTHLAAISSPKVLSGLLQVPRKDNLEEFISLAAVLVKCMRFDGTCRKYISEVSPLAPFVSLLWSNQKRATSTALEFFSELLKMPRSSAVNLLQQIQKQGSVNNMCALFLLGQNSEPEYKLLAANLLLQLEVLDDTSAKSIHSEEAANALVESLACEEAPAMQSLSSFIMSNLGGTYSWTGEPYTAAWLVKKTGLVSPQHKNVIKNYDFSDQCLQDSAIDAWSSKISRRLIHLASPLFHALDKGLKSRTKRVSRDCLAATALIGCELVKGPEELRHKACEIILHTVERFLHPGCELEEKLLACLCIFNYTSGSGMKKIINLSEGVRESLRRLSNVTWMAEELLKVADYFQPHKWRISCVHSQILEAGNKSNGAVTALIYYKGQLLSGYADGSIKVWDIKGQTATLVQDIKEHKKSVMCFALYEPGHCLLSGSADKTIKVWQMLQRNLECIEVIQTKESIRSIDSSGELIFASTKSNNLKIIDKSRKAKEIFKNKRVKCIRASQGKVYAGCTDSSIQELMISNNRLQEIKEPSKSWMHSKPISSVAIYKDLLYSANLIVEGSKLKDWRRNNKPQISITPEKGSSILAMEVVEDFIYLNCSNSMNSIQIWLRGTQHKVGRLSVGSKITSLLSANDMILCGTEKGIIKGWIPL